MDVQNTTFYPHYYFTSQHSRTNNEGIFTIKKISSGTIYLGLLTDKISTLLPDGLAEKSSEDLDKKDKEKLRLSGFTFLEQEDFEPDYEVLSIHRQGITYLSAQQF